jgi:CheY-specific phosphatase CheX
MLIEETLSYVLEQMAMVFTDAHDGEAVAPPAGRLVAEVRFEGASSGRLQVAASRAALLEIASGVLGSEPDAEETADAISDVLCELANVVLGNLLPRLAGEELVFTLTAPEVLPDADGALWTAIDGAPGTVKVAIEEEPLMIRLESVYAAVE